MTNDFLKSIREEVRLQKDYSLEQNSNVIKLNQNESPYDIPRDIKERVLKKIASMPWNRYPDLEHTSIRLSGAELFNIDADCVFPSKGSNEILSTLFYSLSGMGKNIVITEPSYSMYSVIAKRLGIMVTALPLGKNFIIPLERIKLFARKRETGLVVLCSPNNPTGNTISENDLVDILSSADCYIAVDEAYAEFSNQNFIPLLEKFPNLIIIRTMSKAHSCAALRVGWIIADPGFIKIIKRSFLPYHMDAFSERIIPEIIQSTFIKSNIEKIMQERNLLFNQLSHLKGIKTYPSEANFILIEPEMDANMLFDQLLKKGFLVRNVSSYNGLNNHLRISVGRPDENSRLLSALEQIITSQNKGM